MSVRRSHLLSAVNLPVNITHNSQISVLSSQFLTFSGNVEQFITFHLLQSSIKVATTELCLPHFLYLCMELITLNDNMVEFCYRSDHAISCSESSLEAGFRFSASAFKLVHKSSTHFFSQICLFSNFCLYTNY